MAIFAPPLRRTLQEFQAVETQVIGDGSRVRVSGTGVGLGIWQTWTPTLTNLTLGNGTTVARYVQIGKTVHAYFLFTLGSTSAVGSTIAISTPVTAASTHSFQRNDSGTAIFAENGSVWRPGHVALETADTFKPRAIDAGSTYTGLVDLTALIPFTWGTADVLSFSATYEAA